MCCFVYNNILEERNKKSRGADLLLPRQSKWSILFITAKSSFLSRSAELNIVNSCGSFEKWGDIFQKKKMDPELSAPVVVFTLLPRSYLLRVASYFALKLLCGNVRAELASCNTSVAVCALL